MEHYRIGNFVRHRIYSVKDFQKVSLWYCYRPVATKLFKIINLAVPDTCFFVPVVLWRRGGFKMSVGARKLFMLFSCFFKHAGKYGHLLKRYHSYLLKAQLCRSVLMNEREQVSTKDFDGKRKGWVWGKNFVSHTFYIGLECISQYSYVRQGTSIVCGNFLQDIACRKYLWQTTLN